MRKPQRIRKLSFSRHLQQCRQTAGNTFAGDFLGEGFDDETGSCDGGFRESVGE